MRLRDVNPALIILAFVVVGATAMVTFLAGVAYVSIGYWWGWAVLAFGPISWVTFLCWAFELFPRRRSMTVYRPGLPPDVEHRWLRWRRRCTCGWTQRQGPNPFRERDIVHDIAVALHDPDDRESLLGMLFVEHGMDRAQEIMSVLDTGIGQ